MPSGSVPINRLVLWHIPCVHDDCLAVNSTSARIGLALALVPATTSPATTVLKTAAGVTIIGNRRVCDVLVAGSSSEDGRPMNGCSGYIQGWQP